MKFVQAITSKLGALRARPVVWTLATVFCLWAVVDLFVLRLSSGVASSTYDAMVKNRFHAAPNDSRIVIVDIDEASLLHMAKEFGRWPWPRDTLATVLDHIEQQAPAAVVWDVLFSDADRLSPGGDKAFDEAAKRSPKSLFPVVRLPSEYDKDSSITQKDLPTLWIGKPSDKPNKPTVALIPPVLPSIAKAPLGYNNGYTDSDGVLRRYRYIETLSDGSHIQSMAHAVSAKLHPKNAELIVKTSTWDVDTGLSKNKAKDPLIAWRDKANSYPRVPFADVFMQAEGGKPKAAVPSFAGKIVLIGSTASSLHDLHPTPMAAHQAGVDSLATAIDNAVNGHVLTELPNWLQAALAVILTLILAIWVHQHGVSSLDAALLPLPALLLGIGYMSLNLLPLFIDLHLAAGAALLFIASLRVWNNWRVIYWCTEPKAPTESEVLAMANLHVNAPVANKGLDQLIVLLERYAPDCRLLAGDATAVWPAKLNWPELLHEVVVVGPASQIRQLKSIQHSAMQVLVQCDLTHQQLTNRSLLVPLARSLLAQSSASYSVAHTNAYPVSSIGAK